MSELNPLEQYIKLFGKDKIFEWFFLFPKFYYKPLFFFDTIFKKNSKEKVTLSLFFISIPSLVYYLFTNLTFKNVIKDTVVEVAVLITSFLILNFSRILISKSLKKQFNSENIIYFLVISKALSIPFQIIFISLFHFSEKYEFLFIHNLVLSILSVYIFIFSNKIFYKNSKAILIGSLLNITIFNLILITLDKIKFDEYVTDFKTVISTDKIYDEFSTQIESCDSLWSRFPNQKFALLTDSESELFFFYNLDSENDSIISNLNSKVFLTSENFKKGILKKINDDSILNYKFQFKRNKIYNEKLIQYLKAVRKDIKNPLSQVEVNKKYSINNKGTRKAEIYDLNIPKDLYEKHNSLANDLLKFYREKEFGQSSMNGFFVIAFPYAIYYYYK